MPTFDHDYAEGLIKRLRGQNSTIPSNTASKTRLAHHLTRTLQYSRGRGPHVPDSSSWFSRGLLKPLVLMRLLPVVEVFSDVCEDLSPPADESAALEHLADELHLYLALVQADEFMPAAHPYLGPFSIDDWARWHVAHFEHHLNFANR